jgi:hypothetical protein
MSGVIMKSRGFVVMLVAMLMVGMASSASAHGYRGHVGVYIGGPVWGPMWYPPYSPYYYPPQVVVVPQAQPPVYIEQQQDTAPAAAPAVGSHQYWYFCKSGKGYYPYVKECPEGWQKVLPQPEK